MSKELNVINLDGYEPEALNKQGWYLVTFFKSPENSRAFDLAMGKASTIEHDVGIRSYHKDEDMYYEVWEKW